MQIDWKIELKSSKSTNLFCGVRRFDQPSKTRAVVFFNGERKPKKRDNNTDNLFLFSQPTASSGGIESNVVTCRIAIPILHDKNNTSLINFLSLIGFTKPSAKLHGFIFRKEPAAGSGETLFSTL